MKSHKGENFVINADDFKGYLVKLSESMPVYAPIKKGNRTSFDILRADDTVQIDYGITMLSPTKFLFPPRETIFNVRNRVIEAPDSYIITPEYFSSEFSSMKRIIACIHPYDMHAILVLDKVFISGDFIDDAYRSRRESTAIIVLNQTQVWDTCFSYSMGTGPFYNIAEGCDLILTQFGQELLAEPVSDRGIEILSGMRSRKAISEDISAKEKAESRMISLFKKEIDIDGLPELIIKNQNHEIWRSTAEDRCLGCTNCTMVCPTCFCYNIEDENSIDLNATRRIRYWASCQELNFAKVHGGNFRASRAARLRQFVTHKLSTWIEQFGCFGCIGCGRCMYWCPTNIDLVDIAKVIKSDSI